MLFEDEFEDRAATGAGVSVVSLTGTPFDGAAVLRNPNGVCPMPLDLQGYDH